jgi:hypothetical protein
MGDVNDKWTPGQYRRHSSRPVSCSTAKTWPSDVCVYIRPPPQTGKCLKVPSYRRSHLIRNGTCRIWSVAFVFCMFP